MSKSSKATLGLIFITFLSAIQYVFLRNVPASVSTFSFVCITNAIGFVLLGLAKVKTIITMKRKTIRKGLLFALLLTGFNFFLLLGSQKLDSVMTSSLVSLYFVFITPMLLLLKKKVNFFSGIATIIAVIALLLMFGADTSALFSSAGAFYLVISDIFFAAYVIGVSILGEGEDPFQLSFSQMLFSAIFGFVGWLIESATGHASFSLPTNKSFWISALFIGLFIRVLYGIIQISCQKHVPALRASLIFASEIIITLLTNPIMCAIFKEEYTPPTNFQIIGCILFIIATLVEDERLTNMLGYEDIDDKEIVNEKGETVKLTSVGKKMILNTLTFAMITLVTSTIICLSAISFIRKSAVSNSQKLGTDASNTSMNAMKEELQLNITNQAENKADLADEELNAYCEYVTYSAAYANSLLSNRKNYPKKEVARPSKLNAGKWAMQRSLADTNVSYDDVKSDCMLFGNMIDVFKPVIEGNENISTIFLGTKDGLLISYDTYSDSGEDNGESYFEYRDSSWYTAAQELAENGGGCKFTGSYLDNYGRGLTITCVAPVFDEHGEFYGCVAADILVKELNESMVNDGIIHPNEAMLINNKGEIIAGMGVDTTSAETESIFNETPDNLLYPIADKILENKKGVLVTGYSDDSYYVAYAPILSTDWIISIISPVSTVLEPAWAIQDSINDNTNKVVTSVEQGVRTVIQSILVITALILIIVTLMTGNSSKRISDPLKKLEKDVQQISEGNLDQRTTVSTNDEIGSLAKSFNHMTDSLQIYIENLKEVTAREERIAMELSVATNIQASMLPDNFDIFPAESGISLYATMDPAKEVGGDFYDFFYVDDDHLALVMADVSGKGVPAALFMVVSKTLLKNRTQTGGGTLEEIVQNVNDTISAENKENLFVTVWIAIIELSTGKGVALNAGHEHPAIKRANGQYELIEYDHSPAVGIMEGIPFMQHEFQINPGDTIFVYTDGVPEATNKDNELFGPERMIEALNNNTDKSMRELLPAMKEAIDTFVGEAPQFDDITMMGFYYNPQV